VSETDGRAGQEAARLLSAAQDWLRTSAPHLAPVNGDGEPCSCPLCRAVVAARDADPDTLARWVDAAVLGVSAAVAQAASAASDLASASGGAREHDHPAHREPAGPRGSGGRPSVRDDHEATDATDTIDADAADSDATEAWEEPARRVRRIPLDHDLGPGFP
jgi:hypothetical protein